MARLGRGIDGASEYTELSSGQGQGRSCSLVVYGRGQLAADQSTGQPVRVHDQPATYSPATDLEPATLTWAYDVDAYARMVCLVDRPAAELIKVASAVSFDRSVDLPVPFRIGDLPAGYHPQSIHSRTEDGLSSVGVLVQSPPLPFPTPPRPSTRRARDYSESRISTSMAGRPRSARINGRCRSAPQAATSGSVPPQRDRSPGNRARRSGYSRSPGAWNRPAA